MKPREKVVSAHDVQSSLYYCHLTSDQDGILLQNELGPHQDADFSYSGDGIESKQVQIALQTKQNGTYPPTLLSQSTIASNSILSPRVEQTIPRKPLSNLKSQEPSNASQGHTSKILGPRPLTNQIRPVPNTRDPKSQDAQPFLDTEKDVTFGQTADLVPPATGVASINRYITLIRRDPATGNQWNVGRLSPSAPQSPWLPSRSPKHRKQDVLIQLATPGYTRFSNEADNLNISTFTRRLSFPDKTLPTSAVASSSQSVHPTFLTPWQTPCLFQTAVNGRALKCYHNLSESLLRPSSRTMHGERSQTVLVSELRFNLPSTREKGIMKKKENRRPVSFQPPKHSRHDSLDGWTGLTNASTSMNKAHENKLDEVSNQLPRFGRLSLAALHHRTHSDEVVQRHSHQSRQDIDNIEKDDIDTLLDLSLGQEQAGGGFNGNKAKLGKLIIYGSQGLAMLDLLVAANMGLWFNDMLEH